MAITDLRLKLIEIVSRTPGLNSGAIIAIAQQYETYILKDDTVSVLPTSDKGVRPPMTARKKAGKG